VLDDKLDALMAELRAIELWDQQGENLAPSNEISRAGRQARQMRRLAIISEINNLLKVAH